MYGVVAGELGRENALGVLERAVDVCRRLALSAAPEDELRLAVALGFFGRRLTVVGGRGPEAVDATTTAVGIGRRFAGALPLLRADLALLLAVHGVCLAIADRGKEAAATTQEAVELARQLCSEHREAHEDLLAHTLAAFARARLPSGDRSAAARDAADQAVALFGAAARKSPGPAASYLGEARDTYDRLRE